MYSRNYSGKGGREPLDTGRQGTIAPVPPPSYGGTLYISAPRVQGGSEQNVRSRRETQVSVPVVRQLRREPEENSFRTVVFAGDSTPPEERFGRGGYPETGDPPRRFLSRGSGRDRNEGHPEMPESRPENGREKGAELIRSLAAAAPPVDDILLIGLIVMLLGGKNSGGEADDLLIIILAALLLVGIEKS